MDIILYATLATFEILVIAIGVIDARTQRIPNWSIIALICIWAVSSVTKSVITCASGMSLSDALFIAPAPMGTSLVNGLLAAVVFGASSLLLTMVLERITGAFAFGGGDIKLLFAVGLFLGIEREAIALIIACVAFLIAALVRGRICSQGASNTSAEQGRSEQPRQAQQPLPFGPFIALGCVLSLVTLF